MSAVGTRSRPLRWAVALAGIVVIAGLGVMFFPKARVTVASCPGRTGPAAFGAPYAISLRVDGSTVVSTVDFDKRLWRAVDDRVARDGLAPATATALDGAVTLLNGEQASFSSPAAYATLLPLTRADGCTRAVIARSGRALRRR
jgi:hypothetical protein